MNVPRPLPARILNRIKDLIIKPNLELVTEAYMAGREDMWHEVEERMQALIEKNQKLEEMNYKLKKAY